MESRPSSPQAASNFRMHWENDESEETSVTTSATAAAFCAATGITAVAGGGSAGTSSSCWRINSTRFSRNWSVGWSIETESLTTESLTIERDVFQSSMTQ